MNQHYIYLGRGEDGKLWLAGPTEMQTPNEEDFVDFQRGNPRMKYLAEKGRWWDHIATLPRLEYLGQETDFQMYQAVREGVDFEWFHQHLINGKWTFLNYPYDVIDDTRTVAVSLNRLIKR